MHALPQISPSGSTLGRIAVERAVELGLPEQLKVIAGTTDSNAAVLAADPGDDDGITVLGTTLVMKRFTERPIRGPGITSHRVGGRWLCGGASNAGGGVLSRFFDDELLKELSRQIDPETDSGLSLRPYPKRGERFPVDDPDLEPVLEPRPVSDALYLHGLLEGLADIEQQGWHCLTELGASPPSRVISLGGGARNPQWRRLRERRLRVPVVSCFHPPAAGVARLALDAVAG
jgi:sugar (pentulose or hexulose) kinase